MVVSWWIVAFLPSVVWFYALLSGLFKTNKAIFLCLTSAVLLSIKSLECLLLIVPVFGVQCSSLPAV